jgi:hypothetical protein
MSELTPLVGSQHGAFFMMESPDGEGDDFELRLIATYGYKQRKNVPNRFKIGEALVGQAALEQKSILITQAPDDYVRISSGLGEGLPVNVIVLPVLFEDQVLAVVELASFQRFSSVQQSFLEQLAESIGVVLNTIQANMRTEELLVQSQDLTQERKSCSRPTRSSRSRPPRSRRRKGCCRPSRKSCSRRTRSSRRKRNCSRSKTAASRSRTARSSWHGRHSRRRRSSFRSRHATSPSSSPTCRTSCAHR